MDDWLQGRTHTAVAKGPICSTLQVHPDAPGIPGAGPTLSAHYAAVLNPGRQARPCSRALTLHTAWGGWRWRGRRRRGGCFWGVGVLLHWIACVHSVAAFRWRVCVNDPQHGHCMSGGRQIEQSMGGVRMANRQSPVLWVDQTPASPVHTILT